MSIQMAELHYTSVPTYDAAEIAQRAEQLVNSGIELPSSDGNLALLFSHTQFMVEYQDTSAPAQTAILSTDKEKKPDAYAEHLQQSWACDNAAELMATSQSSRLVTEMMSRTLEPSDRIRLFHGVLQAFAELTRPVAIVFHHSQQVVAGEEYLESCKNDSFSRLGALNVRLFNISNSESNDMIMDTRGLDEIGLHDLQCHFHDLDPNEVGQVLFNTAHYIFDNGPVIESGQTIAGIDPDTGWVCQFENSLLDPEREILDIHPGDDFAAGDRTA